ncbi:hypothetical protein HD806DRAFT_545477 [Xylariaceae sp. AK1471]|nr:hypothetical protein HD806DRAFT_545477 [Xylariaceae sp. AK1471]
MIFIMYSLWLLLSTIFLTSLSSAIPVQINDAEPVTKWTTSEVSRQSTNSNTLCFWNMTISSSTTLSSSPNTSPPSNSTTTTDDTSFECNFLVQTAEGYDCGRKTFSGSRCSSNPAFRVSGGHSDMGFIVAVVEDVEKHLRAYFGFDDAALDGGAPIPPQSSTVEPSEGDAKRHLLPRQDSSGNGTVWMIRNLTRLIDTDMNAVHVTFAIDTGDENSNVVPCSLHISAPKDVSLETWQWYDEKCNDSDYYVSWGYLATTDAGIMTLVSSSRDSVAFFGFPNISMSETLGSAGPSPVLPCDCNVEPVN